MRYLQRLMQWYSSRRLFELANKDTSILHRELRKSFTTVLSGDSRRFERTHFACSLVLRFKKTRTRRAPTYPSLRQTTHINHRRLQHVQLTEGGSVLRRPNGVHVHVLRDAQGAEVPQVQDRKELRPHCPDKPGRPARQAHRALLCMLPFPFPRL